MFFALEGLDGSGKSTILEMLEERYGDDLVAVTLYDGSWCEKLHNVFRNIENVSDSSILMGMLTNFSILLETKIQPLLDAGKIVVVDRFISSTFAYQVYQNRRIPTADFGLFQDIFNRRFSNNLPHSILLKVSYETSCSRKNDTDARDPKDQERFETIEKGYDYYLNNFAPDGEVYFDNFTCISAEDDIETVYKNVSGLINVLTENCK